MVRPPRRKGNRDDGRGLIHPNIADVEDPRCSGRRWTETGWWKYAPSAKKKRVLKTFYPPEAFTTTFIRHFNAIGWVSDLWR